MDVAGNQMSQKVLNFVFGVNISMLIGICLI